ncbi:MAG: NADAR family protein [Actinomycetaceae bacterium]|nr:NADAR family protein [Actinomycetaceae bacterium]
MKPEDARSVEELQRAVNAGKKPDYLFFFGHQPSPNGELTRACLSQWWTAPFTVDGHHFPTAEHYMMWRKATLFGDDAIAEQILQAPSPAAAKQLGRKVTPFDPDVWGQECFEIVVAGSVAKFSSTPELRDFLLATGKKVLVEAAPRDRVWGIGMGKDNENAQNPARWRGSNLLGFALMEARKRLASSD